MKKAIITVFVLLLISALVSLVLIVASNVDASENSCGCSTEDRGQYEDFYDGHTLDYYDQDYYEVISINETNIIGEDGETLEQKDIPTKYLEPGADPIKGDWIAVLKDPNTKEIVTIFKLDME